ncbi:hypothetical protein [Helicobacter macacae]|uniref:hypothetical protein n=1 Tax=Helicobacter macacae TaxID=398626 RepID=UPI00041C7C88|nr:hypothetical protein [Helicobacter macacae]
MIYQNLSQNLIVWNQRFLSTSLPTSVYRLAQNLHKRQNPANQTPPNPPKSLDFA